MSISLDPELGQDVRDTARKKETSVSAWLAEAARVQLRHEGMREFLDDWQAEHGPLSAEEIRRAERELGYRSDDTAA